MQKTQEMQEMGIQFLGQEALLEKEIATHSSILTWSIPMDRGSYQSTVLCHKELDMTE